MQIKYFLKEGELKCIYILRTDSNNQQKDDEPKPNGDFIRKL